jgi:hypothetical protein
MAGRRDKELALKLAVAIGVEVAFVLWRWGPVIKDVLFSGDGDDHQVRGWARSHGELTHHPEA